MLIAFISDAHGNLPALKAAVADAESRGADRIIFAGDATGYGPFPSEVCAFLEKKKIASIRGNYDRKVLDVIEHGESAVATLQKKKKALVVWTAKHLSKSARRFLTNLPESIEEELPLGGRLLVVHGSPVSDDGDMLPSITPAALRNKLPGTRPDILVCGHTHIPFVKRVDRVLIINCGSVGNSVDGDPRPSYALLSVEPGAIRGRIVRFGYNVDEVVTALKKTGLPKGLQKDFAEGTKRRFLQ
jgi:putative phosphoesterase